MGAGLNRAVLITGASTGIGRACAIHLQKLGFQVYGGVRKPADAAALEADGITAVQVDVTQADQIAAVAARLADELGERGLYGLVNNAGIAVAGPLEILPLDDLRWQFEVNVVGALAVTQAVSELLRTARGRIVNMGSIASRVTSPLNGPYCMSKHALESMTAALRQELAPWGVDACLVEPGAIVTPIWDKADDLIAAFEGKLDARGKELYLARAMSMSKFVDSQRNHGVPAQQVADAVAHALTSARPRTRYLVGPDARIAARLEQFLPERMLEWFLAKRLPSAD